MGLSSFALAAAILWQPSPSAPRTAAEVFRRLQGQLFDAVPHLITGALVFAIFFTVAWVGQRLISYAAPRVRADTGVVLLLSRVFYYGILIFGIITALSTTGMDVSALVAGLGLTGFALGFALKDVLSNLLSGIMLLIYRPFSIGDQIEMGTYEGTIIAIRMRDTVVRGFDGRLIIIPNTKLITEVVINNNAVGKLMRESVEIPLAGGANIDRAKELFARVMEERPALKGHSEPLVTAEKSSDNVMRLAGYFWYDPRRVDAAAIKDELTQALTRAFNEAGISAPGLGAPASSQTGSAVERGPLRAGKI